MEKRVIFQHVLLQLLPVAFVYSIVFCIILLWEFLIFKIIQNYIEILYNFHFGGYQRIILVQTPKIFKNLH